MELYIPQFGPIPNILHGAFETRALFSSPQKPKSFQDSPSHRIFRHMHETLNIDENKN